MGSFAYQAYPIQGLTWLHAMGSDGEALTTAHSWQKPGTRAIPDSAGMGWMNAYLLRAGLMDCACALAAGLLAFQLRFGEPG